MFKVFATQREIKLHVYFTGCSLEHKPQPLRFACDLKKYLAVFDKFEVKVQVYCYYNKTLQKIFKID